MLAHRSVVSNAEALQLKVSNGCSTESNCLLKSEPSDVEVPSLSLSLTY